MATAAARVKTPSSNYASLAQVQRAMLDKLKDSCLSAEDAKQLRFQPYTADATQALKLTITRAGFKIPYFTIAGKPTPFFRFRYLEYDNARGFSKLVHANGNGTQPKALKHDLRYTQPADTVPELYLSPQCPWPKVAKDAKQPIVITEGELKAACGCKHTIATIGLGGVWNFKSAKNGLALLPTFQEFDWDERETFICFDSDSLTNANVCMAEQALAHQLQQMGALVRMCRLPQLPEQEKTGLDDYLRATGKERFVKQVMGAAELYSASEELYKLNAEVVYVHDPGLVLELATGQRITPSAFVEHAYANRTWNDVITQPNGGTRLVPRSAPKEWIKWPHRAVVSKITYRPGQPKFMDTGELNTWPGWGVPSVKGNVDLWHQLLERHIFAGHVGRMPTEARVRWFEQWAAYPIQHPGSKLKQSVVNWSVKQGTGKSVLGYALGRVYGKNFIEINDQRLQGSFNGWAENKQFIMGDEIASAGERKRETADRMKSMITQKELTVNAKYLPEFTVPDCINYYFTSNHPDAFFMEDEDRRFFVNEVLGDKDKAFFDQFCPWVEDDTGAAALHYYLEHLTIDSYQPHEEAPDTEDKAEMKSDARMEGAESFARALRYYPAETLHLGGAACPYTLWTNRGLKQVAAATGIDVGFSTMFGRKLKSVGFRQVCHGIPVHYVGNPEGQYAACDRLWAIVPEGDVASRYQGLSHSQAVFIYFDERNREVPEEFVNCAPKWYPVKRMTNLRPAKAKY